MSVIEAVLYIFVFPVSNRSGVTYSYCAWIYEDGHVIAAEAAVQVGGIEVDVGETGVVEWPAKKGVDSLI